MSMTKRLLFLGYLILRGIFCFAQPAYTTSDYCKVPGTTPASAYPICPNKVFTAKDIPLCVDSVPTDAYIVTTCVMSEGGALNPFWLKFSCFTAGSFGFTITPLIPEDDYNWVLFDITGRMPQEVYSDSLFDSSYLRMEIACNWCVYTSLHPPFDGSTGASDISRFSNDSLFNCYLSNYPFSAMPNLIAGHNYLMMVMHLGSSDSSGVNSFYNSQNGFSFAVTGGTANIADPAVPALQSAGVSGCAFSEVKVALSKPMQCASLAADGSDFRLASSSPGPIPGIVGAFADTCGTGFDMDSVTLQLSGTLPTGDYTVAVKTGSDGNTLLDACDNPVAVGDAVPLSVGSAPPSAVIDSIGPIDCGPTVLPVVFAKAILCSSVDPSGSNFRVTGPSQVGVIGASCAGDSSALVLVRLSRPIRVKGSYQLEVGADGNEKFVMDQCGQPVRTSAVFGVKAVNCNIAVPGAFTPNGDGNNDYLYPLNAYNATNLEFKVYDRWGRLVFQTTNWLSRWDGTTGGREQPSDTYVWMLRYTEKDTGKLVFQHGTTILMR
jgi:gliding motility-associated-like protein